MLVHDLGDGDVLIRRKEHVLDRHGAEQLSLHRHVAGVDRLLVHTGAADALDGLGNGHLRAQGHVLRGHDGPGGVFGVAQDLVDLAAHLGICLGEDALDHVRGHLFDEIRRVVHIQLAHKLSQLLVRKAGDQLLLNFGAELGKGLGRELLGQQAEEKRGALLIQILEHGGDIRPVHRAQHVLERLILLLVQQLFQGFLESDKLLCHRGVPPFGCPSRKASDTQAKARQFTKLRKRA